MLEFLFGIFIGIWMGQQIPMPSVHQWVLARFQPALVQDKPTVEVGDEQEEIPLFSGEMPAPSV